jgi:hypothetical protein
MEKLPAALLQVGPQGLQFWMLLPFHRQEKRQALPLETELNGRDHHIAQPGLL